MAEIRDVKHKIFNFSLLSILSLFAALTVYYFSGFETNRETKKQKAIEEILRHKENQLAGTNEILLQKSTEVNLFVELHRYIDPDLYADEGLSLFLYENDSLVFWSNNNVPAENIYNRELFSKPMIKYGNGWFRVLESKKEKFTAVGLILLKNDFPYQNQYLTNDFQKDFKIHNAALDTLNGKINIHTGKGDFLFSVNYSYEKQHSHFIDLVIFGLLIICFIALVFLLFYLYHLFDFFKKYPLLLLLAFVIDTLLLRFVLLYFEIPRFLYESELFSPYYYATSFISPSLGDLVINSVMWLALAWIFYKTSNISILGFSKKARAIFVFFSSLSSGVLFYLLICTIRRMVMDSNVELNLNNIFNIDLYSGLAFLALTSLILAYFLVSAKICAIICAQKAKTWIYASVAGAVSLLTLPLFYNELTKSTAWIYPLLLFAYFLSFLYFSRRKGGFNNIVGVLFYIVYFSLVVTFLLDYYHEIKEKQNRGILAAELASQRDPLMEYEFSKLSVLINSDAALKNLIGERYEDKIPDEKIISYLNQNYFEKFNNNYELFITICQKGEILNIQPGGYNQNCHEYFKQILTRQETKQLDQTLFFLDNRLGNSNYIACLNFQDDNRNEEDTMKIFIELFYKYVTETGLGYPDLLIDQKISTLTPLSDYSYAKYYDNKLIYKNGDFSYHLDFQPYERQDKASYFIDHEGYSHYILSIDENNKVLISRKNLSLIDLLAPFSYLFIIFSLVMLVLLVAFMITGGYRKIEFNFSNQLQISIILIIIISFLVLGMITRSNIIHLYNDKNRDSLSEKAFSVLTELEHKLGNEPALSDDLQGYIAGYLNKFSSVFFSDINLYDTRGMLIASSRAQIFEEGLLSARINTAALYKLSYEQSLLFIQNEKIGKQEYLSAYIPFRNNNDEIIAYLNLPYFAKQTELQKEIADFLAAYINVYVLLIVLAIVVTVLVSRFITRPLQLVREKMRNIGLGKPNEKINWKKKDEIGDLIEEYNRMIDELAKSAELLARSERESAWREMARQVAHEIKNPLTPMKLSVQYLRKAWEEKTPDWEMRLERFANTIVEQIDALSDIASEFSDFAKMPAATIEKIELTGIIKSAVELYHHHTNINISIRNDEKASYVLADKRQLLRTFNNLIQNAVQAIGDKKDGQILISVFKEDRFYRAEISDNGTGIPEEQAGKIFSPSFTTKSSGMGLGLAMVKSIMNSINGTVTFESEPGIGTTFIVRIPSGDQD